MGSEYRFTVTAPNELSLGYLGTALQRLGCYVQLQSPAHELSLAYADEPRRADWPEDIVVELDDKRLDVVVHSGTKQQREKFIADLSDVLNRRGLRFEIEEL